MSDCLDVEISNNHQRWRPSPCFQRTLSFAPSFPLHFLLACLSAAASLPILKIHSSWCQVIEGIASWRESRTNATLISSINIHFYSITAFWLGLVIFHLSALSNSLCPWVEDRCDIMRSSSASEVSSDHLLVLIPRHTVQVLKGQSDS